MRRRRFRVVLRVANCEGVSERDPEHEARLALTKPGEYGEPDVVAFSEVSWCDVAAVARRYADEFAVVQHGERGSPEAGVGIAARDGIEALGSVIGSRPTGEGGGIRLRPIVGAEKDGEDWWAVHPPPPRAPNARREYFKRARPCRGIVAGDWNRPPWWMRATSVRNYRGIGVLGVLVPRRVRAGRARPVDIGSDHPAVDVPLWIKERRRA